MDEFVRKMAGDDTKDDEIGNCDTRFADTPGWVKQGTGQNNEARWRTEHAKESNARHYGRKSQRPDLKRPQ
jgi:hypothetical protein